jgi:hypothetical protein
MVTRVTEPNEGDWKKLVKMMNYLKSTKDDVPCMSADDASMIKQVACRCAFAIHKDMKSHTGATMTLGSGTISAPSLQNRKLTLKVPPMLSW